MWLFILYDLKINKILGQKKEKQKNWVSSKVTKNIFIHVKTESRILSSGTKTKGKQHRLEEVKDENGVV